MQAKKELQSMLGIDSDTNYTISDWNEQKFKLGKASLHTIIALNETNFWGPGDINGELECNSSNTIILSDSDGKENKMNLSLLGGFDIGIKQIVSYYVKHHMRHQWTKKRSEKDNKLKLLPTNFELQQKDKSITLAIRLSVKKEKLMPLKNNFP